MTKSVNTIDIRKKLLDVSKKSFGLIGERPEELNRFIERTCSQQAQVRRPASNRLRNRLASRALPYLN